MGRLLDFLLVRDGRVCPWWCCFTFDNPLRKWFQDPMKLLSPYVNEGAVAVDIGAGMGYFSLALCELVGKTGKVIAVDIQERMLASLQKRAQRKGVSGNLAPRLCTPESLCVQEKADFVLCFWMVHEVPDQERFLKDVRAILKPGGKFLVAEPGLHVTAEKFAETVRIAERAGLAVAERPGIAFSRAVLFTVPHLD